MEEEEENAATVYQTETVLAFVLNLKEVSEDVIDKETYSTLSQVYKTDRVTQRDPGEELDQVPG